MIKEGLETYSSKSAMKKHEATESKGKEKKEELAAKKMKVDPKKMAKALYDI